MDPRLLTFLGVAALLTIAPGPDMALVLRNALTAGRSSVAPTALGICAGCLVWGAASSVGIAAVIAASAQLFDALRLLGALYLVFLGIRTLIDAFRHAGDGPAPGGVAAEGQAARGSTGRSAFRQGLVSNLLNPKVGVFYTTFLPQFIAAGQPVFATSMLLAAIHASMGLVWLLAYGRAASRLGDVIRRRRVRQAIETATGTVLIGFGVALAAERR